MHVLFSVEEKNFNFRRSMFHKILKWWWLISKNSIPFALWHIKNKCCIRRGCSAIIVRRVSHLWSYNYRFFLTSFYAGRERMSRKRRKSPERRECNRIEKYFGIERRIQTRKKHRVFGVNVWMSCVSIRNVRQTVVLVYKTHISALMLNALCAATSIQPIMWMKLNIFKIFPCCRCSCVKLSI